MMTQQSIAMCIILGLMPVYGFIAYDCNEKGINVASFNSLEVDHCKTPPPATSTEVPRIKLIQKPDTSTISFKSCLISVDYLITKCATSDDAQVVKDEYFSELLLLGNSGCTELHRSSIFNFPTGGIIELKANETTWTTHTIAGNIDKNGNCRGTSYSTDKGSWNNVVVQANYKIQLSEGVANIISKDDLLILPTGTKMKLSEMYGIDPYRGEIIWDNSIIYQNCDTQNFDVLYDGTATLMISEQTLENALQTHTFLIQSENIVFTLKPIKRTLVCKVPVIQTEHPQLFILEDSTFMHYFFTKNISSQNMDLKLSYVNTKFVYIKNSLENTITSLYNELIRTQCEIERTQLLFKLSLATYSLDEFAYAMGQGPGNIAIKSGEIIYLIKCKPVDVQYAEQTACYNEFPVTLNNKTYFMAPKTYILQKYGTQIDCNEYLPVAFRFHSDWYTIAPTLREIVKPQTLKPFTSWTWNHINLEYLRKEGIYSRDTMAALQKYQLLPQEIQTVQKNIARQSMGHSYVDQGLRLKSLIDEITISKTIEDRMWGWFTIFGTCISGLLGIFYIWRAISKLIKISINTTIFYQTSGCCLRLLAGIFPSTAPYIIHNLHKKQDEEVITIEKGTTLPNFQIKHTEKIKTIPRRKMSV